MTGPDVEQLNADLVALGYVSSSELSPTSDEFGYWTKSGEFVFIAILGGGAHAFGAFAGAAMFEVVRFYAAAQLANAWQLILGVVLIVIILYAPNGLIGLRQRDDRAKQGGH